MKKILLSLIIVMGVVTGVQARSRGYQRTLDRVQFDRARHIFAKRRFPRSLILQRQPITSSVVQPESQGLSAVQQSQEMQAQNLAADMSMGM